VRIFWLYISPSVCHCGRCEEDSHATAAEYLYEYQQLNYPVMVKPDDESNVMFVIAQ
jgi:hypothetical protein